MKIINLKKFIRGIAIIIIVTIFILILLSTKLQSHKEVKYEYISISYGDTLWSIASKIQKNNQYYNGKDVRYIIDEIKEINNLENSNIKEDQVIKIKS